jgi:hypothetical protein
MNSWFCRPVAAQPQVAEFSMRGETAERCADPRLISFWQLLRRNGRREPCPERVISVAAPSSASGVGQTYRPLLTVKSANSRPEHLRQS